MTTLDEFKATLTTVVANISSLDTKLDEVAAYIATLKAGVVTQAQLDELGAIVSDAQKQSASVLAEADALDDVPTP